MSVASLAPRLLRTLLFVLLTLALAVASPAAAGTAPAAQPAAAGEVESAACTGDGELRLTSRRELPAPATTPAHRRPAPRAHAPGLPALPRHVPPAICRTTVLRC